MDIRIIIATEIMNAFVNDGAINHYDGEHIVSRESETGRKITATEQQDKQIEHYTRISFKIADSILKYDLNNEFNL